METSKPKGYEPAPIAEPLLTVDGPVTVEAPARRAHFRDAWAALLLVGNVVALSYVAIKYGADLFQTDADDVDLHFANSKLFQAGCGVAVMAGVFSALYVKLLLHKAGDMIMFSFYVKFALLALAIIACLCSPVPQSAAYPASSSSSSRAGPCVRHRVAAAANPRRRATRSTTTRPSSCRRRRRRRVARLHRALDRRRRRLIRRRCRATATRTTTAARA